MRKRSMAAIITCRPARIGISHRYIPNDAPSWWWPPTSAEHAQGNVGEQSIPQNPSVLQAVAQAA
jgi:hypothetical protein